MALITKTVRASGGDYTDIQSAINFFNSKNFVSDGDQGEILIHKEGGGTDNEWVIATTLTGPTGTTTDSTHGLTIKPVSGSSFKDHASKLSNALRYNPANGVAIRYTGSGSVFSLQANNCVLDGLQLHASNAGGAGGVVAPSGVTSMTLKNCIVRCIPGNNSRTFVNQSFGTFKLFNCLMYGAAINLAANGGDQVVACTLHSPSDTFNRGAIFIEWGACLVVDTLAFEDGTSTAIRLPNGGSLAGSSGFNGTNDTSGGSNSQNNLTDTNVFESVTPGSEDFRLKTGNGVATQGTRRQTETADLDIVGSARSTSTPSIGAWDASLIGGGGTVDIAGSATAGAAGTGALTQTQRIQVAAVAAALGSGALNVNAPLSGAAIGRAVGAAALLVYTRVWRMPTDAANGTVLNYVVRSGSAPPYTTVAQGSVTVAGGFVDLPGSGTPGTKLSAIVENYDGNTATTSINVGAGMATLTDI
ncbi:MAG: hypothetical protein ACREE0_05055 [Phenylobacterium sp.]